MEKITTFDGKTVTPRRVKDPRTDHKLPDMGSLSWSNITSTSALSGTTGVDCSKVKGDRQLTAEGKLVEKYTGDKQIEVLGSHKESTQGDRSITVLQGNHSIDVGSGNRSITVAKGNLERKVPAGKVTDQIGVSHEETVGASYKLQSITQDFQASGVINIVGTMVKINS